MHGNVLPMHIGSTSLSQIVLVRGLASLLFFFLESSIGAECLDDFIKNIRKSYRSTRKRRKRKERKQSHPNGSQSRATTYTTIFSRNSFTSLKFFSRNREIQHFSICFTFQIRSIMLVLALIKFDWKTLSGLLRYL